MDSRLCLRMGNPVENFGNLLLNVNYASAHLWFVYMIIGVYLMIPILFPWAEKVGKRELQVYLGIWLFTTLIPIIRQWVGGDVPVTTLSFIVVAILSILMQRIPKIGKWLMG